MHGLSAVVISYNRIDTIETCLKGAMLVCDQLVVVDKGSTDGTAEVGERMAHKFKRVPWTPIVEETRAEAMAMASGDWVLGIDDDECLNVEAIKFINETVPNAPPSISYYCLPIKHYIMGRHDPRAYYWPEYRHCIFRRGTMEFLTKVHGGLKLKVEGAEYRVPTETGAAIEHLSHKDAATYLEKTNRYTSVSAAQEPRNVTISPRRFMDMMQAFLAKVPERDDGYLAAVTALRGFYDVCDVIKHWETKRPDGAGEFLRICADLNSQYEALK